MYRSPRMHLAFTIVGMAAVVVGLVATPARLSRRAARSAGDRAWVALGAYALALACTGYALLAAGLCAASGPGDRCSVATPAALAVVPALVAAAAFAGLVVLARRT